MGCPHTHRATEQEVSHLSLHGPNPSGQTSGKQSFFPAKPDQNAQLSLAQPLSWGGFQCHIYCHGCFVEVTPLSKHMRQYSFCQKVNTINASSESRQHPSPQTKGNSQKGLQSLHCTQHKGSAI